MNKKNDEVSFSLPPFSVGVSLQVYAPDENHLNNVYPSFILTNGFAMVSFMQALHRGMPEFEDRAMKAGPDHQRGLPFRIEAMLSGECVGKAEISVYRGELKVHDQMGELIGKIPQWYLGAVLDIYYVDFVKERRAWERREKLAGSDLSRDAVGSFVDWMIQDPEMAREIFNAYLVRLQEGKDV